MLVHYYVIRRENIDIEALYQGPRESRVGDVNWSAMASLLVGLVVTWMFLYGLVAPLQGTVARALNGLDLSWLAGMPPAGGLYSALYPPGRAARRAGSRRPRRRVGQTGD